VKVRQEINCGRNDYDGKKNKPDYPPGLKDEEIGKIVVISSHRLT
jgi:hypothetical protein